MLPTFRRNFYIIYDLVKPLTRHGNPTWIQRWNLLAISENVSHMMNHTQLSIYHVFVYENISANSVLSAVMIV